jgi:hypothetical protein
MSPGVMFTLVTSNFTETVCDAHHGRDVAVMSMILPYRMGG